LRVLRNDKKAIFTAFSAARKAANIVCPDPDAVTESEEKIAA